MGTTIKLAWHLGQAYADTFDSLEDAASAARVASDMGDESFHAFIDGETGEDLTEAGRAIWERIDREEDARSEERLQNQPDHFYRATISHDGKEWMLEQSDDEERLRREYAGVGIPVKITRHKRR